MVKTYFILTKSYHYLVYIHQLVIYKKDNNYVIYSYYDINYTEETEFRFDLEIWILQDNYWIKN